MLVEQKEPKAAFEPTRDMIIATCSHADSQSMAARSTRNWCMVRECLGAVIFLKAELGTWAASQGLLYDEEDYE